MMGGGNAAAQRGNTDIKRGGWVRGSFRCRTNDGSGTVEHKGGYLGRVCAGSALADRSHGPGELPGEREGGES